MDLKSIQMLHLTDKNVNLTFINMFKELKESTLSVRSWQSILPTPDRN